MAPVASLESAASPAARFGHRLRARVLHDARGMTHVLPPAERAHVDGELAAAHDAFGF